MKIAAYPQSNKQKSWDVCRAFLQGTGTPVSTCHTDGKLHDGDAVFYGVVGIEHVFNEARKRHEQDWFYLDNAFFDKLRGRFFRCGVNSLQTWGWRGGTDRMRKLGIPLTPWRLHGSHVLVVEQSTQFMRDVACWPGGLSGWRSSVVARLAGLTDRLIVVRAWNRDKSDASASYAEALKSAWVVVTHSSAAACEALLQGVPVMVTDPACAAAQLAGNWSNATCIEHPHRPERIEWAEGLCDSQWTLDEYRSGLAWRTIGSWL